MLLKSNLEANFCTGTYLNLAKIKALNRCAKRKNGCKILQSLKINKVLGYKALEKSKREGKIKSMSGCGNAWPGIVVFTNTVYTPAFRPNLMSLRLLPTIIVFLRSISGKSFVASKAIPGLGLRLGSVL